MNLADSPSKEVRKRRLAVLINTIAPYRLPIFSQLAEYFDTLVLHGGKEANRQWKLKIPEHLHTRRVWTLQFRRKKLIDIAGHYDISYVHINAGLLWWLPRWRPEIIISNELGSRTLIALIYSRLFGVPLWVWWGGTLHSEKFVVGLRKRVRVFLCSRIHRWISYGKTSTEYLESIGAHRSNILQIQNCVPHENFIHPPENPEPHFAGEPRPIIVSVGQLIARKGLDRLIAACGCMAAEGFDFTLVIVGSGPDRDKLMAQAQEAGLTHCHFIPNQPQAALSELYRAAQVFVFPTLEDVWGLVVNEAIWAGTPVLCSKYAGCAAEIVPPGNVFDPVDPESFVSALRKIFDGTLESSDVSKMLSCRQVSDLIIQALNEGIPAELP